MSDFDTVFAHTFKLTSFIVQCISAWCCVCIKRIPMRRSRLYMCKVAASHPIRTSASAINIYIYIYIYNEHVAPRKYFQCGCIFLNLHLAIGVVGKAFGTYIKWNPSHIFYLEKVALLNVDISDQIVKTVVIALESMQGLQSDHFIPIHLNECILFMCVMSADSIVFVFCLPSHSDINPYLGKSLYVV